MNLSQRDKQIIWHPYTQMQIDADPIAITSAAGAWLYAEDGRKYLDAISSRLINSAGKFR
jgi:adenosylmethionine-8-amino-7-oxononanoate aminotransferase